VRELASAKIKTDCWQLHSVDLAAIMTVRLTGSAGTNRGELKKRRRVEFHIEHREVTVFAGAGGFAGPQDARVGFGGSELAAPLICPVCGSAQLLLLTETVASPGIDLRGLQQGMEDGSVHMHCSADGAWWICAESLKIS
jgi:hypothetical protein